MKGSCLLWLCGLVWIVQSEISNQSLETALNTSISAGGQPFIVVTYNLYWWCVSDEYGNCPQNKDGKGFQKLFARIQQNGPFDLIGFQECDDVGKVIGGTSLAASFEYYTPKTGNDAPMAWQHSKFTAIEGPSTAWISRDKYGDRHMNWVRLQVIGSSATIFFANTPGLVTREEWMHFWLMRESAPSHYALAILQGRLAKLARRCPEAQVVGTVLNLFREADSDTDGEISQAKMSQCCSKFSQKSWEALGLPGAAAWLRSAPKRPEAATLNYFEFVSELVGRQRHDVWLYQYSIPAGLAAEVEPAQAALLKSLGGFWHTSIVVFGREYWYGRQCFESKLQLSHFGEPTKRTYLGATQCSQAELWDKIDRELCREYTGDSYDVIQHSSCHFAQEVAWFLLNKHLPDEAWLQPPILASAITDIRPLLNQWFGRLSPEAGADEARGSDVAAAEGAWSQLAVGSLVSFARDGLPNVIAEVISKEAGACDLWWWEPRGSQNGRFVEAVGVSKMQVTNLGRHTGRWRGRRATDKARIPNRPGPAASLVKAS